MALLSVLLLLGTFNGILISIVLLYQSNVKQKKKFIFSNSADNNFGLFIKTLFIYNLQSRKYTTFNCSFYTIIIFNRPFVLLLYKVQF